jgi:hypothetical protein
MTNVRLMCKKGSQACKCIVENTKMLRYSGKKTGADVLVNYGLAGARKDEWLKAWPSARNIPKINANVGHSKLSVIQRAKDAGILAPESRTSLLKTHNINDYIEKRINSAGGKGICKARGKGQIAGKYYQRMVSDRVYELRVHAFRWMPMETWKIMKRLGAEDEIAWNFHQGGHFQGIRDQQHRYFTEARQISEEVLRMLEMSFGAVDFIVTKSREIYFLEVNSQPGFSGLSDNAYYQAFNRLLEMPTKEVLKYAN